MAWGEFLGELDQYPLFKPLLEWSISLTPVLAGVLSAYHLMMRMKAEDDQMAAQHMRSLRSVLVLAAVILAGGHLVKWLIEHSAVNQTTAPCYGVGWKKDGPECPQ